MAAEKPGNIVGSQYQTISIKLIRLQLIGDSHALELKRTGSMAMTLSGLS